MLLQLLSAVLATAHDLVIGLGIGITLAILAVVAATATGLWARRHPIPVQPRLPRQPEPEVDLGAEVRAFKTRRDEWLMGERRVA